MITWLKRLFKEEEKSLPRIIDKPELRFTDAIKGQMSIFDPKDDITPYESAQISNLIGYLILNRYSGTRLDTQKFIENHHLERHFSKAPPIN